MAIAMRLFLLGILINVITSVDRNNFKTCEQSSFCRRLRKMETGKSKFELDLNTLQVTESGLDVVLHNVESLANYKLTLTALSDDRFHLFADEINGLFKRFKVEGIVYETPQPAKLTVETRNKEKVVIQSGDNKATLNASPFTIEFARKDKVVAVINARGLFMMEHFRKKPADEPIPDDAPRTPEDPGAWEENFKSHHDSKPRGPEAVGTDISFPGALRTYGIPEHADSMALRTTGLGGLDPYRLYNLDVFEYEVDSTMALYGSVPVLYAHSGDNTVGIYWQNAAETWVDIVNSKDGNVVSSIVNLVSGQKTEEKVDVHFMSESGVLDMYILMGPTPADAVRQYASLTGVAPLPQLFTLGYHQCRWNYNDEDDVRTVVEKFDENDYPMDVMWLDIEHTDGKKYFTWDNSKFAHPEAMQHNLTATGRHLVTIVDPHVKRESGYFLHEDCLSNDYYVKTKEGSVYEGWCWPGSSSYPDFFDPKVIDYYANLYTLDKYKGSTETLYIWNDMNEPSVFNGPEITMPKDLIHYGNWEHRHVHNLYGIYYSMITYKGLLQRNSNKRPFQLTRAHFAGSQRYTAMWTGDNAAEWSHLAASYPMCLSEALAGISFCGADIGGFFNNPDAELLTRWYQAAVWLPFVRQHAHIDTKRREPYLYATDIQTRIRAALKLRYAHLPFWYTQFYEHERTSEPIIRPLFYEYPANKEVVDLDKQVLIGNSIMATVIYESGATGTKLYLPPNELWYDIYNYKAYKGNGFTTIPVDLDTIPVFYRGGSIIPRKNRPRRASTLSHDDPYTLYVVLDNNKSAKGTLYIDDYESYEYQKKKYVYLQFTFENNKLTGSLIDQDADYATRSWLERVIILGAPQGFKSARLTKKDVDVKLPITYDKEERSLTIRKPEITMREAFTITLH